MDDTLSLSDSEISIASSSRTKRPRLSVDSVHITDDVKDEISVSDEDIFLENVAEIENNDDSDSEEEGLSYLYFTNTVARKKSSKHKKHVTVNPDKRENVSGISAQTGLQKHDGTSQFRQASAYIWTPYSDLSSMSVIELKKEQKLLVSPPDNPYQAFQLFYDDNLLDAIVEQTNKNAEIIKNTPGMKDTKNEWTDLTRRDLKTFIGLLLHTGIIRMNSFSSYWRKHYLINLKCFSNNMKRQRFLSILNNLNFSATANSDRLGHTRPLIDDFNGKMKKIYCPGKQLAIEESMVLWHGRIMNDEVKKSDNDFKLYILAEPDGMVLRNYIYEDNGLIDWDDAAVNDRSFYNRAEKIVLNLLDDNVDAGHAIYMHEYFNSFSLAVKLLDKQIYCTGTLNPLHIKKVIPDLLTTELEPCENKSALGGGVHIGRWRRKQEVFYISTEFGDEMVEVANKRGQTKLKPNAIVQYNMNKSRNLKQLVEYYPLCPRNLPWYTKFFIHLLQMSMLNAYHLYNKHSPGRKMDMYHFRMAVLEQLVPQFTFPEESLVPHKLTKIERVRYRQFEKMQHVKEVVCKNCVACRRERNVRRRTVYECKSCDGVPGYCVACFCRIHVTEGR